MFSETNRTYSRKAANRLHYKMIIRAKKKNLIEQDNLLEELMIRRSIHDLSLRGKINQEKYKQIPSTDQFMDNTSAVDNRQRS